MIFRTKARYFLMLTPLIAACQPQLAESGKAGGTAPAPPNACGSDKLGRFFSTADSPAQRAAITAASGARIIRWLTPGMAVTMDYRGDRLNANIATDGRYSSFTCG